MSAMPLLVLEPAWWCRNVLGLPFRLLRKGVSLNEALIAQTAFDYHVDIYLIGDLGFMA
jgi:hypothetical protein